MPTWNVVVGPGDPPEWCWEGEEYRRSDAASLPELLVELGIYGSRGEARRAGRDGPVKPGFTLLRASKRVPVLCIWKEMVVEDDPEWCAEIDRQYAELKKGVSPVFLDT